MTSSKRYPIAEIFTSPQGEGLFTGCMMTFVRLAGCCVGKPIPAIPDPENDFVGRVMKEMVKYTEKYAFIPIWQTECTTYDGRHFLCDTDYRTKELLTVDEIFAQVPNNVTHLCLTGGEPLIHDLMPIIEEAHTREIQVHIETSGTVNPGKDLLQEDIWITCSPKFKSLPLILFRADEIKLLVDKDFDLSKVPEAALENAIVWLQPVNYTTDINQENLQRCLQLLKEHPDFRISLQLHKILKVR